MGTCPRSHGRHLSQPCLPLGPMPCCLTTETYLIWGHLRTPFSFQRLRVSGPFSLSRFSLYTQATNCVPQCPEITLFFRPVPPSQPPSPQAWVGASAVLGLQEDHQSKSRSRTPLGLGGPQGGCSQRQVPLLHVRGNKRVPEGKKEAGGGCAAEGPPSLTTG